LSNSILLQIFIALQ